MLSGISAFKNKFCTALLKTTMRGKEHRIEILKSMSRSARMISELVDLIDLNKDKQVILVR